MVDKFRLDGRVAVITGGAGLLGVKHAEAVIEAGGIPVVADLNEDGAGEVAARLQARYNGRAAHCRLDVADRSSVVAAKDYTLGLFGKIDILINNAAYDPKVKADDAQRPWSRFENFSSDAWARDLAVGLTGSFICSQVFGREMVERKNGVILNISSDLGIIAPDQRIYRKDGLSKEMQPAKPVTYSVVKHGLIGLTKYLATYWAEYGIRSNALCPGGVYNNQPEDFVKKLTNLIPLGRMAEADEYKAAVLFLCSDASSYMTGAILTIDGGRTCW